MGGGGGGAAPLKIFFIVFFTEILGSLLLYNLSPNRKKNQKFSFSFLGVGGPISGEGPPPTYKNTNNAWIFLGGSGGGGPKKRNLGAAA